MNSTGRRTTMIATWRVIVHLSVVGITLAVSLGPLWAQPAGGVRPGRRPDHRDDWMRESDWIWRSSRNNHHDRDRGGHRDNLPVPVPVGGFAPYYQFGWGAGMGPGAAMGPMGPWDASARFGPNVPALGGPASAGGVVGDRAVVADDQVTAAERGPVDPGTRRYVSRWQRSGRGYVHVFGWQWKSNGVPKHNLRHEFVDRSEMTDSALFEAVPPGPSEPDEPEAPPEASEKETDAEPHADSLFRTLDTDGDGTISADEFRASRQRLGES